LACNLRISLPTTVDDSAFGRVEVYKQRSARPFKLVALNCEEEQWCSLGALRLSFTGPVSEDEVHRRIRVDGVKDIAVSSSIEPYPGLLTSNQRPRTRYTVRVDTAIRDAYGRALEGPHELTINVGDHKPRIVGPTGLLVTARISRWTIPIRVINVAT